LSAIVVYRVDAKAIDHEIARGEEEGEHEAPEAMKLLLTNRPLLWFTAAITLFHFANAAMLPLAGEKLAQGHQQASTLFMASCIVTAQLVMVPMAILVGRKADRWGRKPLFLAGFAVLPLRGLLFAISHNPYAIIAVQVLDGVGAGIFAALFYIVVSDLTRGTGRFNLAQGASAASWGLGAALSNGVAGLIVNAFGFSAAFSFLGACAIGALAIYWFAVPETLGFRPTARYAEGALVPRTART
jgi:MFS family permease